MWPVAGTEGESRTAHPESSLQPAKGGRTKSRHPSQFLHSTERAVGLPVRDDCLRTGGSDSRQGIKLRDTGRIEIDRLRWDRIGGSAGP